MPNPLNASGTLRTRFFTPRGDLTAYALQCGYVERYAGPRGTVRLWHEHGCYHVRHNGPGARIESWEAYPRHNLARAAFRRIRHGLARRRRIAP